MAGIIKADGAIRQRTSVQGVAFNLHDVSVNADSYVDTARSQASRIISRAKDQAEQLREQGRKLGRHDAAEQAKSAARAAVEERLQTLLPALEEAIRSLHEAKQAWLRHWENSAIRLAVAIAEKIIRRELRDAPDISLELIRAALELAAGAGHVTIHLHPDDIETLGEQAAALVSQVVNLGPADIVADPQVGLGGCRLQTEFGEIDQRIESQLARIEEELTA